MITRPPEIIGVAGTIASGKDTAARRIEDRYGYLHVSTSDMVREIAVRTRGTAARAVLSEVANEFRRTQGADVFCVMAIQRYLTHTKQFPGVVISGIRSIGEAERIKNVRGGIVLFVDGPLEQRYARLKERQQVGEGFNSIEELAAFEYAESGASGDAALQGTESIRPIADAIIINDDCKKVFLEKIDLILAN